MFDLYCLGDLLGNFSRSHCIEICAFLVPANLVATSQTILFVFLKRSPAEVFTITTGAIIYALLMISHVVSWLIVGVVMVPTFILIFLGITCLMINLAAIWIKINHIEIHLLKFFRGFSLSLNSSQFTQ